MGVHGLWRLIEPSGKPVPLETLENKVLAVDVSIWLHQAVKGFQDSKGAPVPNAHLLGIYHRVCKLLYFKIKPVFVFDGGVPVLKKQTILKRNQQKSKNLHDANKIQEQLLSTILKHTAISKVLSDKAKAAIEATTHKKIPNKKSSDDLYVLPPSQIDTSISSSSDEEESEVSTDSSPTKQYDLHTIDTQSSQFKSLPPDIRHEILTELKATRKQSSWGRLHELPSQSDDFSVFQMRRLLKRQEVQTAIEDAEKEMGGHSLSLGELESLLNDHGVITSNESLGKRIASDENTRYLLIKDIKKAMEEAKAEKTNLEAIAEEDEDVQVEKVSSSKTKADEEFEDDLKLAIALSLQEEPSTSKTADVENKSESNFLSFLGDDLNSDSSDEFEEVEENVGKSALSSAQNYMKEYSGLTPAAIAKIIETNSGKTKIATKKVNTETKSKIEAADNIVKETLNNDSTATISDEDDSDFLEVTDEEDKIEAKAAAIEIIVDPNQSIEDDLFSDIFINNDDVSSETATEVFVNPDNKMSKAEAPLNQSAEKDLVEVIANPDVLKERKEAPLEEENKNPSPQREEIVVIEKEETMKAKEPPNKKKVKLSVEELTKMKTDLQNEKIDLIVEKSTKERMATNISDQMYQEAQELLELFGVPYIVAPMEAEAQCAFLDESNLTDGTITDDSDIWLFGGKTVYKNFFNQAKQVMEFRAENIKHHFKLSREQMILLALLVGSDYTTGLQGVGPVTALEILAAFPVSKSNDIKISQAQLISGLKEFRLWLSKDKAEVGRVGLRNKLKNVQIADGFPSVNVVRAYMEPEVETSKEAFSWGKLDVVGLIDFAKQKFGWSTVKTEEILKPVLKKIEETSIQKTIKDYFKTKFVVHPDLGTEKMSKRVKTAIDRMGKDSKELEEEEKQKKSRRKKGEDEKEPGRRRKEPQTETNKRRNNTTNTECPKKRTRKLKNESLNIPEELKEDEEIKNLQIISDVSQKKVEEISTKIKNIISVASSSTASTKPESKKAKRKPPNLHKKEVIPQKEYDKSQILRSKMKAIEVFRKSKKGPGYVPKTGRKKPKIKEDAGLSESDSD